jgi:ribosome-associated toxin RatA of RatAB toxin-antitoxin module
MHQTNTIIINGSMDDIFISAADVVSWPEFLAHYRENEYISKMSWGGIIRMHCVRSGINVRWIARFEVDPDRRELRFEHYKSILNMTRGMKVVWTFTELETNKIKVEISHDLKLRWPIIGGLVAKFVVGDFFINYIATRTLRGLKEKIETKT